MGLPVPALGSLEVHRLSSPAGSPPAAAPSAPLPDPLHDPDLLQLAGLSPLEAQKRLTGRVKAARSIQDFAAVISAGQRLIDAICLVAILAGLPRAVQRAALPAPASPPPGPSAPSPASASAPASLPHASSASSSASASVSAPSAPSAAAAAAAPPAPSPPAPAAAAPPRPHPQLSDADHRDLSGLVSGLGSLVLLRLREFDSNGLVTVAVGLAKLGATVGVEAGVFRAILAAIEPRLPGLGTKALANLMWALATAGVQPCGSWLSVYYAAVERQLDAFGSADLANMLWGLAKFDLMPEVWLMDQLSAAALAQLRRSASAADGATVLTCLARYYCAYNYRLPDEALAAYLAALQPGLRAGAPGDLVALVHSSVCMSHMPSRPFMLELYPVLLDHLAADTTFSAADYSRLLWSLSRVDCTPPRSWLREFVELSSPRLPHLRHRPLAELVWALACWDCRPSQRFLDEFFRASARRLQDYRPAQIADTLSALAKLGCRAPSPWLRAMLSAFTAPDALPHARPHELVAVLESAVALAADDRLWAASGPGSPRGALRLVADTAAPRFAVFDACAHARLVLALARANCCPGAAWLSEQQASLASAWASGGAEELDAATAAGLVAAYSAWDVQLDSGLAAELEGYSAAAAGGGAAAPS